MWKRRRISEICACASHDAERTESGRAVVGELGLCHSLSQRSQNGAIGFDRDVVGFLHQGDLGARLDDAAAGRYRICAHIVDARRFLAYAIKKEKPDPFFHSNATGSNAAILEDLRDSLIRALVLFP